jgi:hypothetical protein
MGCGWPATRSQAGGSTSTGRPERPCPINSGRGCLGGGRSRFTGACCLWALIWIDRPLIMVRDTVKERTWRRHEEVVRLHVKPSIGRIAY